MVLFWSWQSTEPIAKTQADPGPLVDTGLWQTQAPQRSQNFKQTGLWRSLGPVSRQTLTQWVKHVAHRPRLVVGLVRPEEVIPGLLLSTYAGLMTTGGLLTWGKAESSDPQLSINSSC